MPMINAPPEPAEHEAAELRSEDDGMPEHPAKAADPAGWAKETAEREKVHALGYPTSALGRAIADVLHSLDRIALRFRPEPRNAALTLSLAAGAGLAAYLLTRKRSRRYFVHNGEIYRW
jgi:hypothetical protein